VPRTIAPSRARVDRSPELSWPPVAGRRLAPASVALALLPIAVAVVRAVRRGWVPVGDNAFFDIRARDVLTGDPPLLGTWSSASRAAGVDFNNPGPLFFDLLAVPARLAEDGAGLAAGVAVVNALAVVGIALVAHRRGGPVLLTVAMAVTAALAWSMGSELLFEPWQPHALLLPFLCFCLLAWSASAGDLAVLPWAAAVGSLVLQTHLSYALLVPALGAWALAGLVLFVRRRRREDPLAWPALRRRCLRWVVVAVGVLVVCWIPPLLEQLGSGEGNLTRLARGYGASDGETIGYDLGARMLAAVVALPPAWLRPSFAEAFLPFEGWRPPSLAVAVAALGLVGAALVVLGRLAWRHGDLDVTRALATAGLLLAVGLATVVRAPTGTYGLAPHQYRWLWPLGAFISFAVLAALIRFFARSPERAAWLVRGSLVVTGVLVVANLPTTEPEVGPSAAGWTIPASRQLTSDMGAAEGQGALLVDIRGEDLGGPFGVVVMAELQRRDVPFVVDEPELQRQLGPHRRFTGDNADGALFVRVGDESRVMPPGARRIAHHHGLSAAEERDRTNLEEQVLDHLRQPGNLRLTERGEEALGPGGIGGTDGDQAPPHRELTRDQLVALVRADLLVLDDPWAARARRYAELQRRYQERTVALFVGPVPP
jgi:hypothetical protein